MTAAGEGPLGFPEEEPEREPLAPTRPAAPGDEPPTPDVPGPARPASSRYGWLVGVVALLIIAYITVNTLRTQSVQAPKGGRVLPPFAVPLALGRLNGDADVARRPDSGASGKRPACAVLGPEVFNVCRLAERSPLVLAFFVIRGGAECRRELDVMQRVAPRFPGVSFAAVSIRGDRGDLRRLIRAHRWTFPIGYDRDGAVANLYGVAVCPTTTLAYPGRVARATEFGYLDEAKLTARVNALVAGARRRGWRPPA